MNFKKAVTFVGDGVGSVWQVSLGADWVVEVGDKGCKVPLRSLQAALARLDQRMSEMGEAPVEVGMDIPEP